MISAYVFSICHARKLLFARSLLRSMALRAGGGRHAMQSPPPSLSPLLAAKKVDFRQLRDSMLCTIMRAAASAPTTTTLTLGLLAPCVAVWMDAPKVR